MDAIRHFEDVGHVVRDKDDWQIVVNTLDPDVVVMGGGMSNINELYDDLPVELPKHTFSTVFHTPIKRAVHRDSSGVRGAAWLWR